MDSYKHEKPAEKAAPVKLTAEQNLLQSVKFIAVSVSAGAIQAGSFALLEWLTSLPYWPKYLIALALSVLFSFTINRRYTFQSAANVPKAMLQLAGFYVVFTAASTLGGDYFSKLSFMENTKWGEYLILGATMLLNFTTEFLFSRFVMYRKSINTNELGKKENARMQGWHPGP